MSWRSNRNRRRFYERWPEYVPVAQRKKNAAKTVEKLKKKGKEVNPVVIEGKQIANTFWGKAWCSHLESYSDFDNRLPRGRSYVRNGSVIDLSIDKGEINALVNGSSLYTIKITISPISKNKWQAITKECAGKIDSLIELLQGKFSKNIMTIITHQENGLFPQPQEIKFNCSCPDYADMCKHIAATLYGVGARLDEKPEQLFSLRHVDHAELISAAEAVEQITGLQTSPTQDVFTDTDLASLFGIDIEGASPATKTQNKIRSKSKSKPKIKGKSAANTKSRIKAKVDNKIKAKSTKNRAKAARPK